MKKKAKFILALRNSLWVALVCLHLGPFASEASAESQLFFPDWQALSFDWGVQPVVGVLYRHDERQIESSAGRDTSTSRDLVLTEAGLEGYIGGVPLWPGNPGLYTGVNGGVVLGWANWDQSASGQAGGDDRDQQSYTRRWINVPLILNFRWYRHTLTLGTGVRDYSPDLSFGFRTTSSRSVVNDFSVLVMTMLSAHYTHTWLELLQDVMGSRLLAQQDHWLHFRFALAVLNLRADAGPGISFVDEYDPATGELLRSGRTDYVLADARSNPIWKILFRARAKYILGASDRTLGGQAGGLLPDQGLFDQPEIAMGPSSYYMSLFAGVPNLFAGFGFGWQYIVQVLVSENAQGLRDERTLTDQGPTITMSARF